MFRHLAVVVAALSFSLPALARTAAAPASSVNSADAVIGVWTTPDDKSHVRIYRNSDGDYYGRIVWLKQPDYPQDYQDKTLVGKPKVDRKNPVKSLRARPIMGLNVLTGFKYQSGSHAWGKGKCYDPDEGKTYTCRMWLINGGRRLKLRGYVWIFHKTQTWERNSAPAAMSAAPAASVPSPATH